MEQVATRGRPREFDCHDALSAALGVFWEKGYDGASLTDLTSAMGITRPSLYAAFGNKESLFKRALDLYETEKLAYIDKAMEAPTGRGVAERLLRGGLEIYTGQGTHRGCMHVMSAVSCAGHSTIRQHVQTRGRGSSRILVARFQRAIDEGDFTQSVDAQAITAYLMTVLRGLSVQASSGASADELQTIIDTTLAMWPGK
ncbi:TetR/AcrR family transcriptional regulator [Altericroceibacterium spongiae]|uniref:TetR/AcrR family transcriptional regulator n=1 Tax=Altericroceibacterium spongiae TaxID=2320269 RepID=A0A420EQP9_9SPHN|nr:TetR/AcrR family transcriptional regulator [Altericroceibacterium spongiae]RKF23003.1 TetR/AcrR family transcriptional regulator [Altericroceibacterium spongiae]